MNDRAAILIRALKLEAENRVLRRLLAQHRADYKIALRIVDLRERECLTWPQIGERVGMSDDAARRRYRRAKEQANV
jgi:hypothetical protein